MGEALLAHAIAGLPESSPLKKMKVDSAGVWGEDGMGATYEAQVACKAVGLDLSKHVAKTLDSKLLSECFALVAMTRSHLTSVKRMFANELPPVAITIKSVVPNEENGDVMDPWGYSQSTYNNVRDEIISAIPHLVKFLEKEASK